ncbi:MAG: SDR family oxidoreductase [Flexilinea sp.]|nr:SDR family oxidoreductase [Flexilinea sp.]
MDDTVLITGAARRLGSLTAEHLAANGCFVWINYRSHETEAFALRDQIIRSGGRADCVRADLSDTDQIDLMLERIRNSEHGELTTLINNASYFPNRTLNETSPSEWDQVMNTNLKAVWYLSIGFADRFPSAKRIISIGDAGVTGGYAGHAVYGLSKYALKYLTEQMAAAFAPRLHVSLLSPGLVLQGTGESDESWELRHKQTKTDNKNIIREIMSGIDFLMSDPGITGSELLIDNGSHLNCKFGNMK